MKKKRTTKRDKAFEAVNTDNTRHVETFVHVKVFARLNVMCIKNGVSLSRMLNVLLNWFTSDDVQAKLLFKRLYRKMLRDDIVYAARQQPTSKIEENVNEALAAATFEAIDEISKAPETCDDDKDDGVEEEEVKERETKDVIEESKKRKRAEKDEADEVAAVHKINRRYAAHLIDKKFSSIDEVKEEIKNDIYDLIERSAHDGSGCGKDDDDDETW